MSTHDELTDLPNHIFLKNYLRKQCNNSKFNGKKFGIMIIYIDGLENIRYILGYEIARTLIQNISERLKSFCKKNNLLSYYSENHFALIIKEYDLDPHFLVMEITESILMQKPDKTASDIKKLQSEGIQIALDDFGTGFSSLAYLSEYNIDILKIDGAFVKKLPGDKSSGAIIKCVINLCGELDIKLVAEGIENWDQLQFLKNLNCHTGQGYIYGKPVPVEEFEKILCRKKLKPVIVSENVLKPMEERRTF